MVLYTEAASEEIPFGHLIQQVCEARDFRNAPGAKSEESAALQARRENLLDRNFGSASVWTVRTARRLAMDRCIRDPDG